MPALCASMVTTRKGAGLCLRCHTALCRGRSLRRRQAGRGGDAGAILSPLGALKPFAATDNLNFGNPEKTGDNGSIRRRNSKGLAKPARRSGMPIVSGNVSLYNETNSEAILPTPAIAEPSDLIDDHELMAPPSGSRRRRATQSTRDRHGASERPSCDVRIYLSAKLQGQTESRPCAACRSPDAEKYRPAIFVLVRLIRGESGRVNACHDISDGGLAVALAELCDSLRTSAPVADMEDEILPIRMPRSLARINRAMW